MTAPAAHLTQECEASGHLEQFTEETFCYNNKAVQRAYARRALVKFPSLEDYEPQAMPRK